MGLPCFGTDAFIHPVPMTAKWTPGDVINRYQMEKATKTPICDIARCLFFSHWHRVNKCTGTKRCRPSLLDTFKPGRLFSSTPISLPLISLPLLSLYLILSRLAGGAEARTAAPASQARGRARHTRGAGRSLATAATAGAGRRRRRRGGARGPHRRRRGGAPVWPAWWQARRASCPG